MKRGLIFVLLIFANLAQGQNKVPLSNADNDLRIDSMPQELKIENNFILVDSFIIDSLKNEIFKYQESNNKLQKSIDSINKYLPIIYFVKAFYSSLELSDSLSSRQYMYGDVHFDLSNFNSLIADNAEYSQKRLDNLSGDYHDRFHIELLSIDDVKFGSNEITVTTKVLYSLYEAGGFYNEEQLSLQDYRGLLKLNSWLDVDVYQMELSGYYGMEDFTKADFYNWIGSLNKN